MSAPVPDVPPHRYTAALAGRIEAAWQDRWSREGTFQAANPVGDLAPGDGAPLPADKTYVLDMFPYPSGAGLHVGHPLGYIGTDVWGRYLRMTGHNVLHTIGFDAFGLPAEQYAIRTGTHPAATTEQNITRYRAQLRRLGFAHDERRSVATTDPAFVRWTQWIFTQLFEAYYDTDRQRARPIAELVDEFATGRRPVPGDRTWADLDRVERAQLLDQHRLVYAAEDGPVNWCPGLGTVLSNEEVTPEGRSAIGNFPVFRRTLRQWMMRITAYADRLVDDLDRLDWPESIKIMQRNWIGRSHGARVRFGVVDSAESVGGLHHPAGHPVRGHLRRPGPRAPAGGRHRGRRLAPRCRSPVDGGRRHPARRRSRPTGRSSPGSPTSTDRRTGRRPGSSSVRERSTRPTARRSRSSSRTTC